MAWVARKRMPISGVVYHPGDRVPLNRLPLKTQRQLIEQRKVLPAKIEDEPVVETPEAVADPGETETPKPEVKASAPAKPARKRKAKKPQKRSRS